MATPLGLAVIFGHSTTSTSIGTGLIQSLNFNREADTAEVRDADGDVAAVVFHNERKVLSVEFVPGGTDLGTNKLLPAPGTTVTIVDAVDTDIPSTHTGKYVLMSASKAKTNTNVSIVTFNMQQWVANAIAT